MIVWISSDYVMCAQLDAHLNDVRLNLIPAYLSASGLISVCLLRRQLLAYDEVVIISSWESRAALEIFCESAKPPSPSECATIRKEPVILEVLCSWTR
jgi:hypothetical protein